MVGEVHEDRLEPRLEEILGKFSLRLHHLGETLIRGVDDLGRLRVEQLEVDRERADAVLCVVGSVELRVRQGRREKLHAHDAEMRERRHRLVRRLAPEERTVFGVGDAEGFVQDSNQLLVDLDQRRVPRHAVRNGVDVADLHRKLESPERFRPDRLQESISHGEEEFGERDSSDFGNDVEGAFRDFTDGRDLRARFEDEEAAKVVERGRVALEFFS